MKLLGNVVLAVGLACVVVAAIMSVPAYLKKQSYEYLERFRWVNVAAVLLLAAGAGLRALGD